MRGGLEIDLPVGLVALVVLVACLERAVPSRIIEIPKTTIRGAQAVSGPRGLISGMDCRMPMMRK